MVRKILIRIDFDKHLIRKMNANNVTRLMLIVSALNNDDTKSSKRRMTFLSLILLL